MEIPEDARRDFVAGCLILKDKRILLIDHDKYGIWLPPGGHVEEGETPDTTAVRETREETGFVVDIMDEENDISEEGYYGLPRPFNANLHRIEDGHWHCDFLYRGRIVEEKEPTHPHEHNGMKWFAYKELQDEGYDIPEYVRKAASSALRSE
ncbi:MAG: NUDIX hydrolase [Candidatus Nanohaloarchaea archaeon]